ncbi:hypothetical protein QR680_014816 [Steinernema hermaphroditum]|uniref:Uncharacterized protein n=1 Tax=Steinernema hermaphroditum TaxID=289476 RepID=A0AA39M4J1_9BILA|nr:hypothetical protein QR680_014816 [Steinernema hermaphroditum]
MNCRFVARRWNAAISETYLQKFKPLHVEISHFLWKWSAKVYYRSYQKVHQYHPSHLQSLSNLNFKHISYSAPDLEYLMPIISLPQAGDLRDIKVGISMDSTPEDEIVELWRILMEQPYLESLSIKFDEYVPMEIFRSYDRNDLPKIWEFYIERAEATADDLMYLSDRVAGSVTIANIYLNSDELLEIIESLLRTPRSLTIFSISLSDFDAFKTRLHFPDDVLQVIRKGRSSPMEMIDLDWMEIGWMLDGDSPSNIHP